LAERERLRLLAVRADALLVEADHLGFTLEEAMEVLRERDAALRNERENSHAES